MIFFSKEAIASELEGATTKHAAAFDAFEEATNANGRARKALDQARAEMEAWRTLLNGLKDEEAQS
jgi:DnaJ-domain-containing protein 1